jgi:hypothetical protein
MKPSLDEIFAQQNTSSRPSLDAIFRNSQPTDTSTPTPITPPVEKRTFMEKVAGFTGGEKIAQGLGQALANPEIAKTQQKLLNDAIAQQGELLKKRKEILALGGDTTAIDKGLAFNQEDLSQIGGGLENLLNQKGLTNKQVIGDALQLGTTVLGAGQLPGMAKSAVGATGVKAGLVQGAKAGAKAGTVYGASSGVSGALKEDKSASEIALSGVTGAVSGAATGAALGGVVGGVSGGVKGYALRKRILDGQIQSGEKTVSNIVNPIQQKAVKIAKQQGFDDVDIEFMNTMKPQDKLQAQKMISLAEKASTNKRIIERPIDIVGDSMIERVKFIKTKNSTAGKAVDATAKALKGKRVDTTSLREKALSLLEDAGVTPNKNGTPNWSKSIFNKTPELQSKLMKSLSDLPAGEIDAYDLHNFKKSIDEVVNYGVGGEGLKGKSASILKAIRTSADEILDANFSGYNKANTDYKVTRDVLEIVDDLFGKKVGVTKERGGQLLRSVFSNNTQRQRVMALVEQLDKTSKVYGGKFKDNLIDQAMFTEILEDVYGTQAVTSLQGQVARAVKGTQKVMEGVRNPLKGAGDLLAAGIEKSMGVSDKNKKKILQSLLKF